MLKIIHHFSTLIVFLIVTYLLTPETKAEQLPQGINFQHPLANKDIVMGEVGAIYQDSQGYMWFGGANALLRYDGYTFKTILLTEEGGKAAKQLPVKMTLGLFEDSDNILWVSTRTGVLRYDPRTELLTQVPNDPQNNIAITSLEIKDILEIPSGELLAASYAGLLVINKKTLNYSLITPTTSKQKSIHGKAVRALHLDKNSNLWVGTDAGLEKLNWSTKEFELFKPYPEHPKSVPENYVTDIISDNEGNLWLATFNGLVYFSPLTSESTRYINEPDNRFSLGGNDIWSLSLDHTGALWIASDGGGITVFEKSEKYPKGRFINHQFEPGRSSSITSNQVRTVYEDRTGDMWIGNYPSGINFFDRTSAAITTFTSDALNPNSLSHKSILSINEDANGNLWFGSDGGGLNYFDRKNETFKHYTHERSNSSSISSNAVLTTHIDQLGNIWVGTWGGGMAKLNPHTGNFDQIPFDALRKSDDAISHSTQLNNAHVWSIKEDRQNVMWVATHAGGLSSYDRENKTFTHYVHIEGDKTSISSGITWDTYEDSKGNFWVNTSTGVNLMDREKGTFKHYLYDPDDPTSISNPSILIIYEDTKGRLWFGTDAGINLMSEDKTHFTRFTKDDGFNDDTIRQILEDKEGKLWISTNNGVSVFDPENKKIKNYNRDSGKLMGGFHTNSGIITTAGEIIFGGVEGVRFFRPDKLKANKTIPPVVLTDLKLFADSVAIGDKDTLLAQSLSYTDSITLDYKKYMFTFEFSALNFRDTDKNRYTYKLEGFDDNWLEVGDQRSAKYTNLSSGTYTFKVRGSNNDGLWNKEGRSINIIQLPPPWLTWWAYTLYCLAILSIIAWFIAHQRQKRKVIEEQNRILEAKVAERTFELSQKNDDIQAMLENMPQGLFTILDNKKIHPEYSRYLEDIFETKEIAGQSSTDLLFSGANIGSDTLDSVSNAIYAIVGEDEIGYQFNNSLLIDEYNIKIGHKTKYLALDWSPIISGDIVTKLMVSVRDVTRLREMESEAQGQKRELDIISQLLNVSTEKVMGFKESASRYLASNYNIIENSKELDEGVIALLFRNMHTIKGNCRTYGFSHLSDVVHEVESTYSALKNDSTILWDEDKLLDDLDSVKKAIAEYSDIFHRVLGKGDNQGARHEGLWLPNATMNKIQELSDKANFSPLIKYVSQIQSSPIEDVLIDVVSSLSSITAQLGKATPKVTFSSQEIRIKRVYFEILTDIFAHILRNSVDHGLEDTDTRITMGKEERGKILINTMAVDNVLNIFINDDGRGLDIKGLKKKGVDFGYWGKDDTPSHQEIAEIIFCSGISTKEAVTDISGRGVGMDAVKKLLTAQGGNIKLILQSTTNSDEDFLPFELMVNLPQNMFVVEPDSNNHIKEE